MSIEVDLQGRAAAEYGGDHAADRMAIYALYVQTADRVSDRRQHANSFFMTLNSAIVALAGYLQVGSESALVATLFHIPVAIAGGLLCRIWYHLIGSYRGVNHGKYEVIQTIEKQLPIRPFVAEWSAIGKGKDPEKYVPFSTFEERVPMIFLRIHVLAFVSAVVLLGYRLYFE